MDGIRSTSVDVTWLPPPEGTRNGVIIAYVVVFGLANSNTPLGSADVSDSLQYTVANLQPYTQFYVKVAAKTSAGVGPYSGDRIFNTLSDGQWIYRYTFLILQEMPTTCNWFPIHIPFVNIQLLHLSLLPFFPPTPPFLPLQPLILPFFPSLPSPVTPAVPGAAPGNVSLHSDPNQAAITVSWSPLSSHYYNSDDLEGYSIHYETNNVRINSSDDVPVGPSTTTRLLTGLHERVAYTISVAAVNAQGIGPYSSELTVITFGQGKGDHSTGKALPTVICTHV